MRLRRGASSVGDDRVGNCGGIDQSGGVGIVSNGLVASKWRVNSVRICVVYGAFRVS